MNKINIYPHIQSKELWDKIEAQQPKCITVTETVVEDCRMIAMLGRKAGVKCKITNVKDFLVCSKVRDVLLN